MDVSEQNRIEQYFKQHELKIVQIHRNVFRGGEGPLNICNLC